jgi:hypothetical protein
MIAILLGCMTSAVFTTLRKPVIYLYPTEETQVTVSLNVDPTSFVTVYPAFDKGTTWNVTASPSGQLVHGSRTYNSLFWEARQNSFSANFESGFVVENENLVKFLEEKLGQLGLNNQEAGDFITYWLPVLQKNKLTQLSFQFEEYTSAIPLEITPKPDTVLRVFMAFKKAKANTKLQLQKLPTVERKGFTVVEWGGAAF